MIASQTNKTVKMLRSLHEKKGREKENAFLIEGAKFVAEITSDWDVSHVITASGYKGQLPKFDNCVFLTLDDDLFTIVSDTKAPQGILAVVKKPSFSISDMQGHVFMLEEMNDPGNLGTVLRTCHGLNISGIILSPNCVDIYSPKVVRSSAGSIFHIPHVQMCLKQAMTELKSRGALVYATLPRADKALYEFDLCKPAAFLFGSEHGGLKAETAALADESISIPSLAESLNVSMCASIVAYEALRQGLTK